MKRAPFGKTRTLLIVSYVTQNVILIRHQPVNRLIQRYDVTCEFVVSPKSTGCYGYGDELSIFFSPDSNRLA